VRSPGFAQVEADVVLVAERVVEPALLALLPTCVGPRQGSRDLADSAFEVGALGYARRRPQAEGASARD